MRIPLWDDIRRQHTAFLRFSWKLALFLGLFLLGDRGLNLLLKSGLDRYYGLDQPATVLCVGHSQTVLGIDKLGLEQKLGMPVAKFAVEGANTADRLTMIRHYLARHPKSVRAVVYGVDGHSFTSEGLSSASYTLLFPLMDDPQVATFIRQHCGTPWEYSLRVAIKSTRYSELTLSLAIRGWLGNWSNLKRGQVEVETLAREIQAGRFRRIAFNEDNIQVFEETLRAVHQSGARMILVYIPTVDVLNHAEPEKHRRAMQMFRDYARKFPEVIFLDYNSAYEAQHDLFFDPIHLNPKGQQVVTERLAADLSNLINPRRADVLHQPHPPVRSVPPDDRQPVTGN